MIRRPPRSTQSRSSAASDVYKRQARDLEDGLALAGAERLAVDGELHGSLGTGAHRCLPSASSTMPVSTGTASNLQTCRQVSHLMQSFWSMTWSFLRSPLMASVGQASKHTWQPVQASASMV